MMIIVYPSLILFKLLITYVFFSSSFFLGFGFLFGVIVKTQIVIIVVLQFYPKKRRSKTEYNI